MMERQRSTNYMVTQRKMDAAYMRDTITPIGEDRLLPVTVKDYQTAVDKISYENPEPG